MQHVEQTDVELMALARPARRWFERREVILASAVCLTIAVFVARELVSSRGEILGLLYVIPVGLVGLELGLRAGVAAALGTLLLVAVRPPSSDPALDALGIAMRGVALLSVGAIAGRFSDRMRAAQSLLQDHFRNAGHVMGVHEQERHRIAEQLHEQAAQALAAALLLVGRLERDVGDQLAQAQVEDVRASVRDCIADLRRLAVSLRPPELGELGLVAALQRVCDRQSDSGHPRGVMVAADGLPGRLAPDVEMLAYRAIEEIVESLRGSVTVVLGVDRSRCTLTMSVQGTSPGQPSAEELGAALATTRARLEIVGGSLASTTSGERVTVRAEIPAGVVHPPSRTPARRRATVSGRSLRAVR